VERLANSSQTAPAASGPQLNARPVSSFPKQAIVVIHGMGEQAPMDTIKSFVRAVWETDAEITANGLKFLLANSKEDLGTRKAGRELPRSPPVREDLDDPLPQQAQAAGLPVKPDRPQLFSFALGPDGRYWQLHHAAPYAVERWTNIFDPAREIFRGDIISGPRSRLSLVQALSTSICGKFVDSPKALRTRSTGTWKTRRKQNRRASL
jgi:hypothetical protein